MRPAIAIACFFLSGAAGLIYEVVWIRRASLVFGSTVYAVSTVLAVFFLGLALGSDLFGRLSQRTHRPLRLYALLEIGLAVFAALSLLAFGLADRLLDSAYRALGEGSPLLWVARVGLVGTVILVPTALMGGTLPLFCRQFVQRRDGIAGSVGFLYGVNTLGAVFGAAAAGFVLIPAIGMRGSVLLGAALNLAAGLMVGLLRLERPAPKPTKASEPVVPPPAAPAATAVLVVLSGFAALGYEVLWTRYLALLFRNTVFTYTLTLTVVLLGIVLGSLVASRFFDRARSRAVVFGTLQVVTGLAVLGLILLPPGFWAGVGQEIGIAFLLLLPPAVLSGASFPLVVRMRVADPSLAGAGVGRTAALNTVGGIAGSLAVGFLTLPHLGLQASTLIVTGLSVVTGIAAWLLLEGGHASRLRWAAAAASLLAWLALPRLAGTRVPADFLAGGAPLVDYREGLQSNLAVVRIEGVLFLEIDHLWQGQSRKTHQIVAAHLPMLLHPRPRRVLVVGAGAGQTPSRFLMYPIERLDCVDIEPAVFDLIRAHFDAGWMKDPRVRLIRDDGRDYLSRSSARYDVISLEIGQVFRPGVASFYTEEFYRRARRRLAPGGIISQFVPIGFLPPETFSSVVATFTHVFPRSTLWYNTSELLLIGAASDSFAWDASRLDARLRDPRIHEDLRYNHWGGAAYSLNQSQVLLAGFLAGPTGLAGLAAGAPPCRDDLPRLEYITSLVDPVETDNEVLVTRQLQAHLDPVEEIARGRFAGDTLQLIARIRERNLGQIVSNAMVERLDTVTGDSRQALALLAEALRANPDNAKANRLMADVLASGRQLRDAEDYYRRAIAIRPEDPLAHRGLGLLLEEQNRLAEAIQQYRAALDLGLEDADLLTRLGEALRATGDLAGARARFERALVLEPGDATALRGLARLGSAAAPDGAGRGR